MLQIETQDGRKINWHVGEPIPKNLGNVVTFQADCDELTLILHALMQRAWHPAEEFRGAELLLSPQGPYPRDAISAGNYSQTHFTNPPSQADVVWGNQGRREEAESAPEAGSVSPFPESE